MIVAAAGSDLLLKLWELLDVDTHTRMTLLGHGIWTFMAVAESHQPIVDAIKAAMSRRPAACRASTRSISNMRATTAR